MLVRPGIATAGAEPARADGTGLRGLSPASRDKGFTASIDQAWNRNAVPWSNHAAWAELLLCNLRRQLQIRTNAPSHYAICANAGSGALRSREGRCVICARLAYACLDAIGGPANRIQS